jgi:hypothetical protein
VQTRLHCPEIPVREEYRSSPPDSFWDKFPFNPLPTEPISGLKVHELEELVKKNSELLTVHQRQRAERCIYDLKNGAEAFQKYQLPPCFLANTESTFEYGKEVTDTIAVWVKKGFAAGPFAEPPVKNFRVNTLMAIKQGEKVRPVLNLSVPKDCSFNSAVHEEKLEKVYMTSVKKFSQSLVEAGQDTKMWKFDLVDAYKNVPAKVEDFRIQGFSWLNKYFLETKQIFGAKTAVCNFDILGNTILSLAKCDSEIPSKYVHRTLDDVPILSPEGKDWGEDFARKYLEICDKIGMNVTVKCEKFEKAFMNSKFGKVLGIFFDTEAMTWCLPFEKTEKTLAAISIVLKQDDLELKQFQQLMGRLNHVSQFSRFLRGFKFNLNGILGKLQTGESVKLTQEARKDLFVFANFLLEDCQWHKLDNIHYNPPLAHMLFVSDAAGNSAESHHGEVGCGNIGFDEDGVIIFAKQLLWPKIFLEKEDRHGAKFGQKTTTLEFIGILLPFLLIPERLAGKYVVVKVDNIACYFAWVNRHSAGEETASIFVRALHLITEWLKCDVHIEHLPRMSNWEAQVADRISRKSSTSKQDQALLDSFAFPEIPECLSEWMMNPTNDWNLCNRILENTLEVLKQK